MPSICHALTVRTEIDPAAIEWAEKAMSRAQRSVIVAGSGLRAGQGAQLLRQVAERLQCPVITTPKGKGVFPESHPLSLGVFGIGGHPSTSKYLEGGVETVLAIGTSMSDLATNGWSPLLQPSRALIQVDIEAAQLGRAYEPQLAIAAPAEQFLSELAARLAPVASARSFGVEYHQDAETSAKGDEGRITPQRALWELQQKVPEDAIYTVDSGEHTLFAIHHVCADHQDTFMVMTGLGAMGSSVGSAVGVQLARPDRTVVAVVGDGGFAMCASELSIAVAEKAPIVVAVFNDGRLGMVENGQKTLYGRTPNFSNSPIDVERVGAAYGAEVAVIEQPGEILSLAALTGSRSRPLVLDIRIDRTAKMPRNSRLGKLAADIGWSEGALRTPQS